jgi:uncharacterized protein (DUF433 family)
MVRNQVTDEELIEQHIMPDPGMGRAEARMRRTGTHVWALIGYLRGAERDPADLAAAYELTREEIDAALAYYRRYRAYIDARLLLNEDVWEE